MLNLNQSNEYRRFAQLDNLFGLSTNKSIFEPYLPFKQDVAIFHGHFEELDNLIPDKGALTTGITLEKILEKEAIAKVFALVCSKTKDFAIKSGDTKLEAAMNVSERDILHMKEVDILPFVSNTIEVITPFLANVAFIPYGITAPFLAAQLTKAINFNGQIGAAKGLIIIDSIANKNINKAIKVLQSDIKFFDLLINQFEDTNPDFVDEYHKNAMVVHMGVHHSGIQGTVAEAETGAVIYGATIRIIGLKKVAATNLLGKYIISPVQAKDYQVQVGAPGYATQTVIHHIYSGNISVLHFVLVKL